MRYHILLIDLDDTLFDFKACEKRALEVVFKRYNIELSEEIRQCYFKINHHLWHEFELGNIKKEDVLNNRFRNTFKELGILDIKDSFEEDYQSELANGAMLVKDALEVIQQLSKNHRLFVVSNGVAKTQYARLKASGLYPYFEKFFISEEVGFQKPQIEFMNYVKEHIEGFSEYKTLLIGDSEASDIKGAVNLGIDSCIVNHSSPLATYQISELRELQQLCDGIS